MEEEQKQTQPTEEVKEEVQEEKEQPKEESSKKEEGYIFIGAKPFMNYVTGVIMQFNTNKLNQVTIKSRGKFISKAVDVAEVARRKFFANQNIVVKDVKIGSEKLENKEGKPVNVSTLEIVLARE